MRLNRAKQNQQYIIESVNDSPVKKRLLSMGFTPCSRVFVLCLAPFKRATLVLLRGRMIALRVDAAATIEIREEQ